MQETFTSVPQIPRVMSFNENAESKKFVKVGSTLKLVEAFLPRLERKIIETHGDNPISRQAIHRMNEEGPTEHIPVVNEKYEVLAKFFVDEENTFMYRLKLLPENKKRFGINIPNLFSTVILVDEKELDSFGLVSA